MFLFEGEGGSRPVGQIFPLILDIQLCAQSLQGCKIVDPGAEG